MAPCCQMSRNSPPNLTIGSAQVDEGPGHAAAGLRARSGGDGGESALETPHAVAPGKWSRMTSKSAIQLSLSTTFVTECQARCGLPPEAPRQSVWAQPLMISVVGCSTPALADQPPPPCDHLQ